MDVNDNESVKVALQYLEEKLTRVLGVSVEELRKMKITYAKGVLIIKE